MQCIDTACCYRCGMVCVCMLCLNGWTNRDAVRDVDSVGCKEPRIGWGTRSPGGRGSSGASPGPLWSIGYIRNEPIRCEPKLFGSWQQFRSFSLSLVQPAAACFCWLLSPSVPWRCWLGGRKGIQPVKNWVVGCWRGCLSGVRCRLAYGPADATATHCLLLQ